MRFQKYPDSRARGLIEQQDTQSSNFTHMPFVHLPLQVIYKLKMEINFKKV